MGHVVVREETRCFRCRAGNLPGLTRTGKLECWPVHDEGCLGSWKSFNLNTSHFSTSYLSPPFQFERFLFERFLFERFLFERFLFEALPI